MSTVSVLYSFKERERGCIFLTLKCYVNKLKFQNRFLSKGTGNINMYLFWSCTVTSVFWQEFNNIDGTGNINMYLFWSCTVTSVFWQEFKNWLLRETTHFDV